MVIIYSCSQALLFTRPKGTRMRVVTVDGWPCWDLRTTGQPSMPARDTSRPAPQPGTTLTLIPIYSIQYQHR